MPDQEQLDLSQFQPDPVLDAFVQQQLPQTPEEIYREKLRRFLGMGPGQAAPTKTQQAMGSFKTILSAIAGAGNKHYVSPQDQMRAQADEDYKNITGRLGQAVGLERANNTIAALAARNQQFQDSLAQRKKEFDAATKFKADTLEEKRRDNEAKARARDLANSIAQFRANTAAGAAADKAKLTDVETRLKQYQLEHPGVDEKQLLKLLAGNADDPATFLQAFTDIQRAKRESKYAPQNTAALPQLSAMPAEVPDPNGYGTVPAVVPIQRDRASGTVNVGNAIPTGTIPAKEAEKIRNLNMALRDTDQLISTISNSLVKNRGKLNYQGLIAGMPFFQKLRAGWGNMSEEEALTKLLSLKTLFGNVMGDTRGALRRYEIEPHEAVLPNMRMDPFNALTAAYSAKLRQELNLLLMRDHGLENKINDAQANQAIQDEIRKYVVGVKRKTLNPRAPMPEMRDMRQILAGLDKKKPGADLDAQIEEVQRQIEAKKKGK